MPSEKILKSKKEAVKNLAEKINSSYAGVLVNYKGIDVENDTKMRKEFRENGIEYFVVKNSILGYASKEANLDFDGYLEGTTAIALSKEDPISAPKIISKYLKELEEETDFSIKAGFMDKNVIDANKVKELGSLPSKEQLIAQLLSLLVSPARSLAIALNDLSKKVEENGGEFPKNENKKDEEKSETAPLEEATKEAEAKEEAATKVKEEPKEDAKKEKNKTAKAKEDESKTAKDAEVKKSTAKTTKTTAKSSTTKSATTKSAAAKKDDNAKEKKTTATKAKTTKTTKKEEK